MVPFQGRAKAALVPQASPQVNFRPALAAPRRAGIECAPTLAARRRRATHHTPERSLPDMSWTDERVETLKSMWSEGKSASQIAKELGGVTRNAVIGKVHRLGLSNRVGGEPDEAAAAAEPVQEEAREPAVEAPPQ